MGNFSELADRDFGGGEGLEAKKKTLRSSWGSAPDSTPPPKLLFLNQDLAGPIKPLNEHQARKKSRVKQLLEADPSEVWRRPRVSLA
jgi:hypothetical protein